MSEKSTELLVPSQTAQKWKKPLSSHLEIKEQAREQNTLIPSTHNRRWMFHFPWHLWNNMNSGVCMVAFRCECSLLKERNKIFSSYGSAFKSVTVVKMNNQILQNLTLQNTVKKFGGECMERTARLIANKRAIHFQFPKADVLSTAMTAKMTSLFFLFLPFPC